MHTFGSCYLRAARPVYRVTGEDAGFSALLCKL